MLKRILGEPRPHQQWFESTEGKSAHLIEIDEPQEELNSDNSDEHLDSVLDLDESRREESAEEKLFDDEHDFKKSRVPIQYSHGQMHNRHISWHDLFFDLVFVAANAKLGERFQTAYGSAAKISVFFSLFLPLYTIWLHAVLYINRFEQQNVYHVAFFLLLILLVICLALNIPVCFAPQGSPESTNDPVYDYFASSTLCEHFIAYFVISRLILLLVWLRIAVASPAVAARRFSRIFVAENLIIVVICLTQLIVHPPLATFVALWWIPLLIDLLGVPVMLFASGVRRFGAHVPTNIALLDERLSLLVLVALGETVVTATRMAAPTEGNALSSQDYLRALSMAMIAFTMHLLYMAAWRTARLDPSRSLYRRSRAHGLTALSLHGLLVAAALLAAQELAQIGETAIVDELFERESHGRINDLTGVERFRAPAILWVAITAFVVCCAFFRFAHLPPADESADERRRRRCFVVAAIVVRCLVISTLLFLLSLLVYGRYVKAFYIFATVFASLIIILAFDAMFDAYQAKNTLAVDVRTDLASLSQPLLESDNEQEKEEEDDDDDEEEEEHDDDIAGDDDDDVDVDNSTADAVAAARAACGRFPVLIQAEADELEDEALHIIDHINVDNDDDDDL